MAHSESPKCDYKIFQKDSWTEDEVKEIIKYLHQDIELTKRLFEWYENQFSPLKRYLPQKDQDNFLYMKSSLSALAYNIICNKAGLKPEYADKIEGKTKTFSGGHHIEARQELVKGNIIEVDFTSAYPHAIMMCNLHSFAPEYQTGWSGDDYYNVEGEYDIEKRGPVELALEEIFLERIKAKKAGEKEKDKSYKIIINSAYGLFGNPTFRTLYSRSTASDCTSIVRTWLKKLAKTLEVAGFVCLYGFTDSIFVLIPKHQTKEQLMYYINKFIKDAKKHVPFPMDTFNMSVEEEIKMIWFVSKNCYLFVTTKDKIEYKSTLLNTNTPEAVMKLFKDYMTPIILEKLDIPFTKKELEEQLRLIIEKEHSLAAQEYKVTELSEYKVKTSLQYQISDMYGVGRHLLIPNRKGLGVGLQKSTKKKVGIRHCSIEEFKNKNLTVNDIDLTHLLSHLKPFYERNEKKENDKEKQQQLL